MLECKTSPRQPAQQRASLADELAAIEPLRAG